MSKLNEPISQSMSSLTTPSSRRQSAVSFSPQTPMQQHQSMYSVHSTPSYSTHGLNATTTSTTSSTYKSTTSLFHHSASSSPLRPPTTPKSTATPSIGNSNGLKNKVDSGDESKKRAVVDYATVDEKSAVQMVKYAKQQQMKRFLINLTALVCLNYLIYYNWHRTFAGMGKLTVTLLTLGMAKVKFLTVLGYVNNGGIFIFYLIVWKRLLLTGFLKVTILKFIFGVNILMAGYRLLFPKKPVLQKNISHRPSVDPSQLGKSFRGALVAGKLPRESIHSFSGPKLHEPSSSSTISPPISRSVSRAGGPSPVHFGGIQSPGILKTPVSHQWPPSTPKFHTPSSAARSAHPSPSVDRSIVDDVYMTQSAVDTLFEMEKEKDLISRISKTPPAMRGISQSTPMRAFQPASRSAPEYAVYGKKTENKDITVAMHVSFEDTVSKLEIDNYLDLVKKLKSWFHSKILTHVNSTINQVDEFLTKENAVNLTTKKFTLMGPVPSSSSSNGNTNANGIGTNGTSQPIIMSLQEAAMKSNHPIMKTRLFLEPFLLVPRTPLARPYIVDRISALVKDTDMGSYSFDGGMTWHGQKWTNELPSDAEIVFHLFCTFMDEKMKSLGVYSSSTPFSQNYVTFLDNKKTDDVLRICICHRYPLKLSITIGKQIWDIHEGRNNLFYTILVFIKYYQKYHSGYLDSLYLGGSVGLFLETLK